MNILHLCGFLGADPEERYTPDGRKLWELRLATRSYKNGQEETIWWRITVWGDQFDNLLKHFKKGKPIYIIAEMNKLATYTDKNGQVQVSYEAIARSIHFLPVGDRQEGAQPQQQSGGYKQSHAQPQQKTPPAYGGAAFPPPSFGDNEAYAAPQRRDYGAGNPLQAEPSFTAGNFTQFAAEEDPVPF